MNDAKEKGFRHGGNRRHVGIYPTAEEDANYTEACKLEGVSKSKQGVELIVGWTQRTFKKHNRESEQD